MDSIPIARSNLWLLRNQHRRLVIGGLCWLFRSQNGSARIFLHTPDRAVLGSLGECAGECCFFWGGGTGRRTPGGDWRREAGESLDLPCWKLVCHPFQFVHAMLSVS